MYIFAVTCESKWSKNIFYFLAMDLRNYLEKVFPNKEEEKYSNMMEDFKRLGIDSSSDLKYLNEKEIEQAKSLTSIDARKLLASVSNRGW